MLRNFVLLLPCYTCLYWAVTLFLRRKENSHSQNIWIASFLVLGISTYIWSGYFFGVDNYRMFYKLELVEAFCTLLLLPLLYFQFKLLTGGKPLVWPDYLWLLPAVFVGVSMAVLYLIMGETQAELYIYQITNDRSEDVAFTLPVFQLQYLISIYVYKILVLAEMVLILVYATIRLIRYRKQLNEFFSTLEGKSMENNNALLAGLYIILLLSLASYRGRFHYGGHVIPVELLMMLWAALIYYMGYNVAQIKYTAEAFVHDLEKADREAVELGYELPDEIYNFIGDEITNEAEVTSTKKISDKYSLMFKKLIDEEQIFLQSDLRLDEVARMMHTNRTYVSRLLKEKYDCSFSDFINYKRIEYAQKLMQTDHKLSQAQIAERSGFQHPASFSRTFKQQAGVTFREWQKNNVQS